MKILLPILFIAITSINAYTQIKAKTEEGKLVILNSDGTWNYQHQINDPALLDYSLECKDLIDIKLDKVSGKTQISSKPIIILKDGKGLATYLLKLEKSIIWITTVVGAGPCIDEDDKMLILFRDGTRLTLTNDGDFNCKSKFTLYFGDIFGKKPELAQLFEKEIETIRVWTTDGYVEKDLTEENSKKLMHSFQCIINK